MKTRVYLLGHPVHQMLIVFPLGLLATGVIFDILYFLFANAALATAAFWMITAGIVGGLIAAPFGWLDWSAIPEQTRAKKIGLWHGLGNGAVVLLFFGSWLLRLDEPGGWAYVLSFAGAALAVVTAWLGGELVDRLGVGVYNDAHVDASSSLSEK